jgi:predicted ATPase/DNA-binding winged helix-turn-helix (wHTH) protein
MNGGDVVEQGYRFGAFRLLPLRRRLLRGDDPVQLSPRAISILTTLVERHDRIVTKDEIFAEVWPGTFVEENNLTVHISALRKALGADAITTIPGRGYKFTAEIELPEGGLAEPAPDPYETEPAPAKPETNLPQRLAAVIGREAELAELALRVAQNRLVTLAGPSGIGKTRLAVELGWRLAGDFSDGVWLIDLAPLTDPAVVTSTTATVLGAALRGADTPVETIAATLAKKQLLLVFDNCEHLIAAAAELIEALLERVPGLSILATSQETLRIPAEQVYRLNPLALPPPSATEIAGFGAVALFVERAKAADRRFALDGDNDASVVEICRRLDGIPLALEMAAARLPLLGIEGLRTRLDERLHMLSTGPRTAEWRHRTLRDTVAWSYGLLDTADQQVFRRLSGFAGSFSLDAAIAVAGGPDANRWELVDALGRLVDKSLVTVEGGEQPRYRLLETLRLYALERLSVSGESEAIAERHARYFTELFDRAYEAWETTPDAVWLGIHAPEIDNVRAALDWAHRNPSKSVIAISLAGSAALFWEKLSLFPEGRLHVERAAGLIDQDTPLTATARLFRQIGILWHSSDRLRALPPLERSATIYRRLGDRLSLASVLGTVGSIYGFLGRYAEAKTALYEAQEILSATNRGKSLFNIMNNLGVLGLVTIELVEAQFFFQGALDLARTQKDTVREIQVLANLAEVEFGLGAIDRAVERGQEAVSRLRSVENHRHLGWALVNLASYLVAQNNSPKARSIAEEALSLVRTEGGFIVRVCLQQWALLYCIEGQFTVGARLIGFVDDGFAAAKEIRQSTEQQIYDRLIELLEAALPASDIRELACMGAQWSEHEAVTFVLGDIASRIEANA